MKIFGTDGIRGEAGNNITPFTAIRAGLAAGIYFKKNTNTILIGKDTRRSGYMIENGIVSALTSLGYNVIQIGPMPTPAIAFLTEDMRCDVGIMISASHNPYYDNGIKFFDSRGYKLDENKEEEIEKIYNNLDILRAHFKTKKEIGSSKRIDDVIGRYIVHIKNSFPKNLNLKNIKIVIDTANGAGYKVAPIIFSELGAEVVTINNTPNGYNINESCGAMHPESLSKKVLETNADIGFALDGDADRLVVVDNKGKVINGDKLLGTLAIYLKKQKMLKNNGIVTTIMSNIALEKFLIKNKINLVRSNVGDKFVLESMIKHSYNFGGEQSGHIIFSDYAKTGDGILSALQIVSLMVKMNKKSSEILNPFFLYPQILRNINISTKKPLEEMECKYKKLIPQDIRYVIRYSGTENKLRILLEGKDKKNLESSMNELEEFFKKEIKC
ncbi:phosphoglucosamine mutase [Helicobacter sp. MIT 14-3879]|uniref:phosphoglucosamine mutase n=1 Tax=Helicobacter sp. MIT 14-3879 TaxID=2040649 RepID=UPI000E1E9387|nr:phosphoglucosamine mutase [Helicobacter sp. MIT 14-3879]RDU63181.1 phosphoglucosamine mutase [Helicobacter sp. MIT 14-3879]